MPTDFTSNVNEQFQSLFGRDATSNYWNDALNDPNSGITQTNLRGSILRGAADNSQDKVAFYSKYCKVADQNK